MPNPKPSKDLKPRLIELVQTGQFKIAEKLFDKNRNRDIQDLEIWQLFAQAMSQTGNFPGIASCCRKILEAHPGHPQAALNLAVALQNAGDHDAAIAQYTSCIGDTNLVAAGRVLACVNCAKLHQLQKQHDLAIDMFAEALSINDDPAVRTDYAESLIFAERYQDALTELQQVLTAAPDNQKAIFLLAQLHYETKNYSQSDQLYRRFLQLNPDNVNALNNLGRVCEENTALEDAASLFTDAIKLAPKMAVLYRNLGRVSVRLERHVAAEEHLKLAAKLEPENPDTYLQLGKLYLDMEELDKARESLQHALTLDAETHMNDPAGFISDVRYFLSNLEAPGQFDDDKKIYVAGLFDKYADKFDDHLVGQLQYRTPEIINELIAKHVARTDNTTMDLGCGTGLCCRYLKPCSTQLIGLDLSSKMIDKARELGCYDELIVGEICEVLDSRGEIYDLVIAADVLVYIGSLQEVFRSVREKISDNGVFIFSIEALDDEETDFRQFASGRHKHTARYIESLASDFDFTIKDRIDSVLRKEYDSDVHGSAYVMSA